MVFSSLIFIYAFLPLTLVFYALGQKNNIRNYILLVASLIFYTWGEPVYVLILIAMTFIDWVAALLIQNVCEKSSSKKTVLVITCIINLLFIGIFKYTGFFLSNIQAIFGIPEIIPQIALPIGISFYTFQLLSYVADVYRAEVPAQKKFSYLLLYSSLFFQCIAGPIVRYSDVEREIEHRTTNFPQICEGISRFTIGLGKKALIANICGSLSDQLLVSDAFMSSEETVAAALSELSARSAVGLIFGVFFYMLQIYLDFSAYSDMAIGMGLMVGFHFKENFNYPYTASSVTDFWRKWHISLSSFFRDYVYIPLGGNRKGKFKTYRNILVVWLLTGLWHGASWNFVLWGLFFCVFLLIEKAGLLKLLKRTPYFVGNIYTLIVVFFGWILFRFSDFRFIPVVIKGIFGLNNNGFIDFETKALLTSNLVFIVIAVISVTPLTKKLKKLIMAKCDTKKKKLAFDIISVIPPILILILSTIYLVGDSYNPFLYFQF
ncbi:MAG: MBOAT family protein [Clostridia bacterium]|nr:MBOAT family protein [Clostridia bacterium]